MNFCRNFIMTCADVAAKEKCSYVPVKKTLPVLYQRIGEKQVNLMLASFICANYHGRMQKSIHEWAISVLVENGKISEWPDISPAVLYDFAKAVIKLKREGGVI